MTNILDGVVARRIQFKDVESIVLVGIATILRVDDLSQNTGTSGFTYPSWTSKQKGLCQFVVVDFVHQGLGHLALTHYIFKGGGTILPGRNNELIHDYRKVTAKQASSQIFAPTKNPQIRKHLCKLRVKLRPMNIGDSLQHFELKNFDGSIVSTYHLADKSALLVVVTCNHCPYAQAYWHRLIRLAKQYEEDNLGVIAINGNDIAVQPADSFEDMQRLVQQYEVPFPYLHDESQAILKQLGATKTPEVFLFNARRELVYKGAIDDAWDNEAAVMRVYLEDAIEFALDGLEIDYPEVPAVGCSIKWKS
jgi:peroxiredoxin